MRDGTGAGVSWRAGTTGERKKTRAVWRTRPGAPDGEPVSLRSNGLHQREDPCQTLPA
jgi:hypothetical protein